MNRREQMMAWVNHEQTGTPIKQGSTTSPTKPQKFLHDWLSALFEHDQESCCAGGSWLRTVKMENIQQGRPVVERRCSICGRVDPDYLRHASKL